MQALTRTSRTPLNTPSGMLVTWRWPFIQRSTHILAGTHSTLSLKKSKTQRGKGGGLILHRWDCFSFLGTLVILLVISFSYFILF